MPGQTLGGYRRSTALRSSWPANWETNTNFGYMQEHSTGAVCEEGRYTSERQPKPISTNEPRVLRAIDDSLVESVHHLAVLTQMVPSEVRETVGQLVENGLVELIPDSRMIRLTPAGARRRRTLQQEAQRTSQLFPPTRPAPSQPVSSADELAHLNTEELDHLLDLELSKLPE